jgi:hypothetical protein
MADRSQSGLPGGPYLAPETLDRLREALANYIRAGTLDHQVRAALREICREARASDVRPEHVLIDLKRVYYSLPGVERPRPEVPPSRMLERLVTVCVEEYFPNPD